jgi:hypothetical protein
MKLLGTVGRVIPAGSYVTGLMVWRDVDFGVDAAGLGERQAWETMWPLVSIASSVRYKDDRDDRRHYFVLVVDGWKLDVSFWTDGVPAGVEPFQAELQSRLEEPDLRLTILRLKDHWHQEPSYPETVGGFEIYDAVLYHGVRTLEELDHYLGERALPARALRF